MTIKLRQKILKYQVRVIIGATILLFIVIGSGFYVVYSNERKQALIGEANFELNYRFRLENDGPLNLSRVSIRLAVLKDWDPVQRVNDLEIGTLPNLTTVDEYTNQFAWYEYNDFQVDDFLDLRFDVNLTLNLLDFTGLDLNPIEYNPSADIYKRLTAFHPLQDTTDPGLISTSSSLTGSQNPIDIAYEAYNFSSSFLRYRLLSEEKGSSFALRNGYGDCDEYTSLFIALLRARGIPAIDHTAWLADFQTGLITTDDGAAAHAYPMFYVQDFGMLPADPTRGNTNLFENWLKTDEKRITMTRGPDLAYRLLRYNWVPVDGLGDPIVTSNYTIEIENLDMEYFSQLRTGVVILIAGIPFMFLLFILINGRKIQRTNELKRIRILSPSNLIKNEQK